MTEHRTARAARHGGGESILVTPEQHTTWAADQARRDSERIRRAHDFRESLTSDFDRELFLDQCKRDNPYAGALIGGATRPEPAVETEPARGVGNGYTGRDRTPSYGSVAQTLAKAATAIDRMNPED